jgi:hypothetical protein
VNGPGPSDGGGSSGESADEVLIRRLSQLALVDLDALVAGAAEAVARRLLLTHAEELQHALGVVRERTRALRSEIGAGVEPLDLAFAAGGARHSARASDAAQRASERLGERSRAARALSRLDAAAAPVLPRLFEIFQRLV